MCFEIKLLYLTNCLCLPACLPACLSLSRSIDRFYVSNKLGDKTAPKLKPSDYYVLIIKN